MSDEERHTISVMCQQECKLREIARFLKRAPSTISRELKRNSDRNGTVYSARVAGEHARGRRKRSKRNTRYQAGDFTLVDSLLREDFSPEQVVGHLKLQNVKVMSHETIYRRIIADKKEGGTLWRHLRCLRKPFRKRYGGYDSRGRLRGKKMIGERPAEAEKRERIGDWEIDTVHGKGKAAIVTIVERRSGFVRIGRLSQATADATLWRTLELMLPEAWKVRTITADNGSEFHMYKKLEEKLRCQVYFATPHHAWERGSNENANGLIRQYLPKGMDLEGVSQRQCELIAWKLNNRPRKRHGYRTPHEVYYGLASVAIQS